MRKRARMDRGQLRGVSSASAFAPGGVSLNLRGAARPATSSNLGLRMAAAPTSGPEWKLKKKEILSEILAPLMESNKKWISAKKDQDPAFFDKLGSIHTPEIMWIGCVDSRVAANEVIGVEPGDVFVHRNIANTVMTQDFNLLSGLQYAVDVLEVEHIIVCGHSNCGGVAASTTPEGIASPLENWVAHIGDVYRSHQEELNAIEDTQERLGRLTVLNVVESCQTVYMLNLVQRRLAETASVNPYPTPRIHAMVYNVGTGELEKVNWVPDHMDDIYGMRVSQ
mmetsp:Transcript_18587/g.43199  ORF Transcript_18587/g.43199 Transcript_18587/m.43199 type:complete len:281 (-) Transcript_18587:402-1244(-)